MGQIREKGQFSVRRSERSLNLKEVTVEYIVIGFQLQDSALLFMAIWANTQRTHAKD